MVLEYESLTLLFVCAFHLSKKLPKEPIERIIKLSRNIIKQRAATEPSLDSVVEIIDDFITVFELRAKDALSNM